MQMVTKANRQKKQNKILFLLKIFTFAERKMQSDAYFFEDLRQL